MAKDQMGVETRPYLVSLAQLEVPSGNLGAKIPNKLADSLKQWGVNPVLPLACLATTEGKYHLLTGLPIYQAASQAGLKEIWIFLFATQAAEAKQWLEVTSALSKLNDTVIEARDVSRFLEFVNDKHADLTTITGIGKATAQAIVSHRPYKSLEDMQQKFAKKQPSKRPLQWIRAYKKK